MKRRPVPFIFFIGCMMLMVCMGFEASAEIIRPEVIIVLDTSGSMNLPPGASSSESNISGSDCAGDRTGMVDLCGDGMCSGLESMSSCTADCTISDNDDHPPGMGPACKNYSSNTNTQLMSRMYMVKRVLRNILPSLREQVNVGLVTYQQDGYFEYFSSNPQGPRELVTAYFPMLQLQLMGNWDAANSAPLSSFTREGVTYSLVSTSGLAVPVDSLYNNVADATEEARFAFVGAGHNITYNAKDWQYIGSFYTFEQQSIYPEGIWSDWDGCSSSSPCGVGEGDCDDDNDCAGGLECAHNVGEEYWNPGDIDTGSDPLEEVDVCEDPASSVVQTAYHGPQYVDGAETWVYRRFVWGGWSGTVQGIDPANNGSLIVPLAASDAQADIDPQLLQIMIKINLSSNGGIMATGNTPTGEAIETASSHFIDRVDGTGPFSTPDFWSYCRARFLLVLTDGESNHQSIEPDLATQNLFNLYPDNPVRTLAVALPGLTSTGGLDELAVIADLGDDGVENGSSLPFSATNEQELIKAIEDAIAVGVGGGDSGTIACYKSCDAENPCPEGQVCVNDSYCVEVVPVPDAGVYLDGAAQDGGVQDSGVQDSGVQDNGAPDAAADSTVVVDSTVIADSTVVLDGAAGSEGGVAEDLGAVADAANSDSAAGSDAQATGDSGGQHDLSAASDSSGERDTLASADSAAGMMDRGTGQGGVDVGFPAPTPSDGCNCAVTDSPSGGAWIFLLGLLLIFRRRRG